MRNNIAVLFLSTYTERTLFLVRYFFLFSLSAVLKIKQCILLVSSAKLKRKKNWFGTTFYTELTADGEIKKTAKSSSSSNPKWDEQLTV